MVSESLLAGRRNLAFRTHLQQRFGGVWLGEIVFDLEHINTRRVADTLWTNGSRLFENLRKVSFDLFNRPNRAHSIHHLTKIRLVTF